MIFLIAEGFRSSINWLACEAGGGRVQGKVVVEMHPDLALFIDCSNEASDDSVRDLAR